MTATDTATAMPGDDARATTGWLHRRAGLGLGPDEIAARAGRTDLVDDLLRGPTGDPPADPWAGDRLAASGEGNRDAVLGWLRHLLSSPTTASDRRTLLLHGWLVSGLGVSPAPAMAGQIRLFNEVGGGSFPDLLRAVTVDPAMLVYLDGRTSRRGAPNENFARELLELFALGLGGDGGPPPYTEDDVRSAAAALTGWVVDRRTGEARLAARRHDDTPRTVLGVDGVRDVDGVIGAITDHPEHPRFVARRIAREYVGTRTVDGVAAEPDADVVATLATAYEDGGRTLDGVVETALRIVVAGRTPTGRHEPIVSQPIVWLAAAVRTLGLPPGAALRAARGHAETMGQSPLVPPSVAGWPGGTAWLTTGALVARTNVAAGLADATPAGHPVKVAIDDGDLDVLAVLLGLLEPFSPTTASAVLGAASTTAALTLALVAPEYLLT